MPLPPPPAEALIITGKPISRAMRRAAAGSAIASSEPGTVLTPAFRASRLLSILSPMASIAGTGGPMKTMPASSSARAKPARSERNP